MRKTQAERIAIAIATAVVNEMATADTMATCITCVRFNEAAVWCTKYGGHPPPRVIAYACGGYEDETLPPID